MRNTNKDVKRWCDNCDEVFKVRQHAKLKNWITVGWPQQGCQIGFFDAKFHKFGFF